MHYVKSVCSIFLVASVVFGCQRASPLLLNDEPTRTVAPSAFEGREAGNERAVAGVELCWCPPGKFTMGSPESEPERRSGEEQVEVTLSKGFWTSKCETTQGQWKRVVGNLPGEFTAELPESDDLPVGNVNFAEAEGFCKKLTELGHTTGDLPMEWEFQLPTEAQWEYACRAGTTTATSFGDMISSKQANFLGAKPYNGGEVGLHSARLLRLAAILPTHGAFTTCMATPANGAATGITRCCRAASTQTCTNRRRRPSGIEMAAYLARGGAVLGPTMVGPIAPRSGNGSSRSDATTTLDFALWPFI